ncbi:MAG: deoxyhypusine synthase [Candidatus Bathyarchaeota archaeon]|nr:deoxyhypusine synthase [Candidatus Bathyarchaeota archaeon]
MKNVTQIRLKRGITVAQLIRAMDNCGVLGAGKLGKAARLVTGMFKNPDYTVFLTLAGALVPGGLRNIIAQLIESGHVNVIVTTGANMVHDMVEALGYRHKVGTFRAEDEQLKREDIGRIGDIYVEHRAFKDLEKWLYQLLEEIPEQRRLRISPSDLLFEIGKRVADQNSILATAARKNVPVICPGLPDSIVGFQLWIYGQDKKLVLDPLGDVSKLVDEVYEAKKSGIIILGGGLPKHFALFANTFREGVDAAVQITMDRPEPGGLSGASLEEAISWSKVKSEENTVTVICDATIAFPLIVAAALEEL